MKLVAIKIFLDFVITPSFGFRRQRVFFCTKLQNFAEKNSQSALKCYKGKGDLDDRLGSVGMTQKWKVQYFWILVIFMWMGEGANDKPSLEELKKFKEFPGVLSASGGYV